VAKRKARPPVDDPVTAYAKAVVAKTIIAGLMVRQACARHLRDLETAAARGLVWKPDQAQIAIDFFHNVLHLPDEIDDDAEIDYDNADDIEIPGKPFLLSPFQKFIVGSLDGWYRLDGYYRFRIGHLETAKGSGKTPLAAGILLKRLVLGRGRGRQNYIAATMRDQAKLTFTDAANMVLASPSLKARLHLSANAISDLKTGSFIKAVSAESKGLDGKRVEGAVVDEVQEQPSNVVVEKIRAGFKNRRNALGLLTMNSGYDRTSVAWELHEYSRQVLEGTIVNDSWFAYVCQMDPCDACYEKGHRAPQEKCDACDQWHTEGPHWLKVNPNIGVSLSWEYLREQVLEAIGMPTKQAIVMRLNFCIWTDSVSIWIPRDQWDECAVDDISSDNADRLPAVASLDLSVKFDLSTCMIGLRHDDDDDAGDVVEISGTDPETGEPYTRTLNLDFTVELIPFFWMPEDTLNIRVKKDKIPFDVWKKQGALEVTKGPIVDYNVIYERLTRDADGKRGGLAKRFALEQIGYDQYNATHIGARLRDEARLTTVELKQGKFLSEALKTLQALVRAGRVRHAGNPVMGWCVSNAQAKEDRFENIWVEKPSKVQRIDGVTTAAGVIHLLMNLPRRKRKRGRGARVWTPEGFKDAGQNATV
jgi:phage terminase large subunit-like protein